VLDNDGERLFARSVANDQADLEALVDRAAQHGTPGLVIDQPGSIAQLALAVAARRGTPVAYVPGLVMRRAADLYLGEAKTDLLTELREGLWQVSGQIASRVATVPDHDHGRGRAAGFVAAGGAAARVAEATGDLFEPFRLVDADGVVVVPVAEFFRELAACGRPVATHRSYGMDLLRWWRFLWAVGIGWDRATSVEARDFCCWIGWADKPLRRHWRYPGGGAPGTGTAVTPGTPNPVTGKRSPGRGYATATVVHCESVLRGFYGFHLEAGTGPMVNPFPLARGRRGRANAHHNPMAPFTAERAGRYRPKMARRVPRQIPEEKFGQLFAGLGSHRDRALVAFWVSTGSRASELLGATAADADPGQQLITVIRKGTRALQQLPASPDAFVGLRLYQAQMAGLVPPGRDQPLWWTLRRPFRALTYDAARAMFTRASAGLGANWSLHDLRHSAAYRMEMSGVASAASFDGTGGRALPAVQRAALGQPLGNKNSYTMPELGCHHAVATGRTAMQPVQLQAIPE
jgi:integrase